MMIGRLLDDDLLLSVDVFGTNGGCARRSPLGMRKMASASCTKPDMTPLLVMGEQRVTV